MELTKERVVKDEEELADNSNLTHVPFPIRLLLTTCRSASPQSNNTIGAENTKAVDKAGVYDFEYLGMQQSQRRGEHF